MMPWPPSIQSGDWIWIQPGLAPQSGDVVLLPDPLDPQQTILRRVLGVGGKNLDIDRNGSIRLSGKRVRQKSMGDTDEFRVIQENIWRTKLKLSIEWRILHSKNTLTHTAIDSFQIPENHLFLMADHRDHAVDSRWWGTVPESNIEGVLRLRIGPSDTWRNWIEWY